MNGGLTKKPREEETQDGEGGKQRAEGREMWKMLRVGKGRAAMARGKDGILQGERGGESRVLRLLKYCSIVGCYNR